MVVDRIVSSLGQNIKKQLKGRIIMKPRMSIVKDQQRMEDLQSKKNAVIKEAADVITSNMMSLNKNGEMSIKMITDVINSLTAGWSDAEKTAILAQVIAKLVVNL